MEERLKTSQKKLIRLLEEYSKSKKTERLKYENILLRIEARLEGIKVLLARKDVQLLKDMPESQESLDNAANSRIQTKPDERFKQILVEVMSLSLQYWIQTTEKTKIELAQESHLWTVSSRREGTYSTRTLDRYLSLKNLPQKPRWRTVLQTAYFVIQNCPNTSVDLKRELLHKRSTLEKYFN